MISIELVRAAFAERLEMTPSVVGYFGLFKNIEKNLYCHFENKLRAAFRSRVKLEYHLVCESTGI
jgi:hypothetical protein